MPCTILDSPLPPWQVGHAWMQVQNEGMNIQDVFADFAQRPKEAAHNLPTLSAEQLNEHPSDHPNSIAWLLWHTGREIDVQLSHLNEMDQVWKSFRGKFGLGELGDSVGYGHSTEQAGQIQVSDQDLLVGYVEACLLSLIDYISTLTEADFDEIIDRNWEPAVTRGVRLVSIIDDATQHVAQAAYAAGAVTAARI